ncbi:uncharacterized protein B0I36DRAFT_328431, partial [Microdochium trichocladiopsis]
MASTVTATPPASPRKLFKPSSRTKAPTPVKSAASTVRSESSPPPLPRSSAPAFATLPSNNSFHLPAAQEQEHGNKLPADSTKSHPVPATPKRSFSTRTGSPVFRRKTSTASTTFSGYRSPSAASDYTTRSLRAGGEGDRGDPRSIAGDDDHDHDEQRHEAPGKVEHSAKRDLPFDSSSSPEKPGPPPTTTPLTPTQIFKARARRSAKPPQEPQVEEEGQQGEKEEESPSRAPKERERVSEAEPAAENLPTAEEREPTTEDQPAGEDRHTNEDQLPAEDRSTPEAHQTEEDHLTEENQQISEDESPSENDKEILSLEPAEDQDAGIDSLSSRVFGNLTSGASTIAEVFHSPTDLIKYFTDNGHPEMSDFVSALQGEEAPAEKRDGEKNQPTQNQSNAEGTTSAPRTKPIRRPGIMKPGKQEDGTQFFDNMGRPARIERSVDIPLQRGERKTVEHAPPPPGMEKKPEASSQDENKAELDQLPQIKDLASPDDLASTEHLRSTDELEDPPEEYLDPEVHSPRSSANVTPIPRIGRISPIQKPEGGTTMKLPDLASGLEGYAVDDVGNVVNEKGKVLGYVTGDLPSMVGKKIAQGGKIYDDNGEVLGHVTENFTLAGMDGQNEDEDDEDEDSEDDLTDALNGLRVDHDGNILDKKGNIVGRLNQRPAPSSRKRQEQNQEQPSSQAKDTEPGKEPDGRNKNKGRSPAVPADICLDVKSTYDGIQIIIKIPTMFDKPPQTITIT